MDGINYPNKINTTIHEMKKITAILISLSFLSFMSPKAKQVTEVLFYIKDKGLYIHFNPRDTKTKVSYKEKWDFYFSVKNDSTAHYSRHKTGNQSTT
jgi:hypothetical protein